MTMHVNSSHKGGVGKTLLSLCQASHALRKGKELIMVDCNNMNPDISGVVFDKFHVEAMHDDRSKFPEDHPPIWQDPNPMVQYTVAPDSDKKFSVVDATSQDAYMVTSMMNGQNNFVICDTNHHIKKFRDLPPPMNEDQREYYWFIWGWSNPRMDNLLGTINESIKSIEQYFPQRQVIHVFNMYDFFNVGLSFIKKHSKTIKPLHHVMTELDRRMDSKAHTKVYFGIERMMNMILECREEQLMYEDTDVKELPGIWANSLMDMLSYYPNQVPYNMLVVPTFYEELVMTMDRLIMAAPRSWGQITTMFNPMMKYIHHFMNNLERFGK